jgi:hypothetical protein
MMRSYAIAAALALVSGASGAAPLEVLCNSLPPAAEVRVLFAPSAAQLDDSKSARDLRLAADEEGAAFRHLGVTRATLQRELDIRLEGYTDERTGRACAWPKVELRLSVSPLLVELARELEGSPCLRAHVFNHEMQHVAIYNASAQRAAAQIEREMRAELNQHQLDGDSASLMRDMREQLAQRWLPRLDDLVAEGNREHDALDAAEERQAFSVCNGVLPQILKTIR